MQTERFGTLPDGTEVQRIVLEGGGLRAWILTYGSVLQDLRLDGHAPALVLGFPDFEPYPTRSPYFGATAGRCANRIRDGHLELDGVTHQLDRNFLGKHHLHGGAAGIAKRVWRIGATASDSVTLEIALADGEMGYPGNMQASVTYSLLPGGVLDIRFEARADAPTVCNLAHHSYFNLDGSPSIAGHRLQIAAQAYLPVDEELIPTGERRPVAGTRFDFQTPKPIGPVSEAGIIDHNFCLSEERQALRPVALLESPRSGVTMELRTTEPGLQVYDGGKIDIDQPGLTGTAMRAHAGIAMEPQVWPDANHHAQFPQAVLRPPDTYRQHTQYAFSKEDR